MNEKYLKLNKQYQEALTTICRSPGMYNRFLETAAFNFRLSFQNAVAAFAQDTVTDLLLTFDQWQMYGRVPRRYSKATLLFDMNAKGRYIVNFSSSKTVADKRIHQPKELRFFNYKNSPENLAALQQIYHSDKDSLQAVFYDNAVNHAESILEDSSVIANQSEFVAKSVTNMLMRRFGEQAPYQDFFPTDGISQDSLPRIWQMVIDVFRAEYADISHKLPAELKRQQEAQPIQNDYSRYTPLAQKYFTAKDNYPDALLVMRVGDFYEALGDDARVIADQLEFVLTSRTIAEGERTPMCGFPAFKYDDYISQLLAKGNTVGMLVTDENGEYQVELRTPDVTEEEPVESVAAEPTEAEKPVVTEPEPPKIYQVITNAGDDGGYDEKLEYATVKEAINAGVDYLADGYLGFSVYNRETKKIEHTEGKFDIQSAYSDDVLKENQAILSVINSDRYVSGDFDFEDYKGEFEDKSIPSIPFFGNNEDINTILLSTPHLKATKEEIAAYFVAEHDEQKRVDYIKSIFNHDFTEVIIPDGRRMGYKAYRSVLHLWTGGYGDRTSQSFYQWGVIAQHFEGLRLIGELHDTAKPQPNQEGQLELIPGFLGNEKQRQPVYYFCYIR